MKDITRQVFGRLTAIAPTEERISSSIVWLCLCSCGNECKASIHHLHARDRKSCGCLQRERANGPKYTKHGHARQGHKSPVYRTYIRAKDRCTNPNTQNYQNYGGRGIEFRFNSFEEFFAELGPKPEPKELYSIDRINNEGHYEVGNVRWSTQEMQQSNKRPRLVTI